MRPGFFVLLAVSCTSGSKPVSFHVDERTVAVDWGQRFELEIDPASQRILWHGRGVVLSDKDKEALAVASRPVPGRDEREEVAARLAGWLAEAPVGEELGERSFALSGDAEEDQSAVLCTVEDHGLTILSQCCGGAEVLACHDACNHGGRNDLVACGVRKYCDGACGQHCEAIQIYTQDCLNHDVCAHHQAGHCDLTHEWYELTNHKDCGNEYRAATDDFLKISVAPFFFPPLWGWVAANACPNAPPDGIETTTVTANELPPCEETEPSCHDRVDNDCDGRTDEPDECDYDRRAVRRPRHDPATER